MRSRRLALRYPGSDFEPVPQSGFPSELIPVRLHGGFPQRYIPEKELVSFYSRGAVEVNGILAEE